MELEQLELAERCVGLAGGPRKFEFAAIQAALRSRHINVLITLFCWIRAGGWRLLGCRDVGGGVHGRPLWGSHDRRPMDFLDGLVHSDGRDGGTDGVASRIVFACDAFDAMTSARPYHVPRTHADAIAELQRCAGTQFDPHVVEELIEELRSRVAMADRADRIAA